MRNVRIYTTDNCPYCQIAKQILDRSGIPYEEINISGKPEMRDEIERLTGGRRDVPQIFFDDEYIGDDDAIQELAREGKLEETVKGEMTKSKTDADWDVIILGSGPAGLTAAIYCGRAELKTLLLTGRAIGGQIALTENLENYPGFPDGIPGSEFVQLLQQQAEKFGAKLEFDEATKVDVYDTPFKVETYSEAYLAKSVIVATGASPRLLDVPGEKEYTGRGVSYCAVCDGFFYKGKKVAVIGGGDSAVEEGIFLTKFADQVTIIHRRDRLRASQVLQNMAFSNEKIKFIWDTVATEITGDGNSVTGLKLRNVKDGRTSILPVDGIFIYIGHIPNTQPFGGKLRVDENGFIVTDHKQMTNIDGIFAAGDVQAPTHRQAIVAAGTGAVAAMEAERYIAALEGRSYPGGDISR